MIVTVSLPYQNQHMLKTDRFWPSVYCVSYERIHKEMLEVLQKAG